jgi:CelD/BcsL family acetyltransferase involved in cellulose biosynthesis
MRWRKFAGWSNARPTIVAPSETDSKNGDRLGVSNSQLPIQSQVRKKEQSDRPSNSVQRRSRLEVSARGSQSHESPAISIEDRAFDALYSGTKSLYIVTSLEYQLFYELGLLGVGNFLKADVLLPSELSATDIAVWDHFNIASPAQTMAFLSYSYALAAEKVFGNVRVCRIEAGGEPVVFFPFQYRSLIHRLFGIGQRIAGELSDYYGVVAKPNCKIAPRELLILSRLSAILFTHLDESQLAFGLSGEAPEAGHVVDFSEGAQAYWRERRSQDKKFTSDTERRERRLVQDFGPISFQLQTRDFEREFDNLISAKREQYARTKVDDPLQSASTMRFLRELSTTKHPLCSGLMSTLYAGNTWVASHFGLRCDKTLHYWFPAYNSDLHSYGPGRLLFKQVIEQSETVGICRIDRGAGDTAAKKDFSTDTHLYYRGMWHRNDINALLYRIGLSGLWRYKARSAFRISN